MSYSIFLVDVANRFVAHKSSSTNTLLHDRSESDCYGEAGQAVTVPVVTNSNKRNSSRVKRSRISSETRRIVTQVPIMVDDTTVDTSAVASTSVFDGVLLEDSTNFARRVVDRLGDVAATTMADSSDHVRAVNKRSRST